MTTIDTSVEATVLTALRAFPTLFSNRLEVLHHVLCVAGNGYKWDQETGTPVLEHYDARNYTPWSAEAYREAQRKNVDTLHLPEDLRDDFYADIEVVIPDLEQKVAAAETNALINVSNRDMYVYPQSESALLSNVPDNVSSDWKKACEQVRAVVTHQDWVF